MVDRILHGTAGTAYTTLFSAGTATDPSPDSATVTVTKSDGTVLYADAAAINAGAGKFGFTLTPTDTAQLDLLKLVWKYTLGGVVQTTDTLVEIVGGFLFSSGQARATSPLNDATKYPIDAIVKARTRAEQGLENWCERAFVPRFERHVVPDLHDDVVRLKPNVRTVRTLTVDGTDRLADYVVTGYGLRATSWWPDRGRLEVAYEHGDDDPPADISAAALRLAVHYLVDSPQDDRALRIDTADSSQQMSQPGAGRPFGIPWVDAIANQYRLASLAA